jgi:hypothetical protein
VFYLSAAYDVTARLSLFLAGSYQLGAYEADQTDRHHGAGGRG